MFNRRTLVISKFDRNIIFNSQYVSISFAALMVDEQTTVKTQYFIYLICMKERRIFFAREDKT